MVSSISEILDALPIKENGIIFHVSSGNLRTVDSLAKKNKSSQIIAVDVLNTDISTKHHNVKYLKLNIDNGQNLPLKNYFCDAVVINHAIRNIIYRESFLKECKRILKPGGLIVVIESQIDAFGTTVNGDMRIIIDDMLEYLDRAGFILGENFDTNHHEYGIIGVCPLHVEE